MYILIILDNKTKEKIEKLKSKQAVLKARLELLENRAKTKERKLETRRKILVGSYFIEKYTNKNEYDELVKLMDKYLTRESDRNVFGLDDDKNNEKKSK
jgi:hypothetical protein